MLSRLLLCPLCFLALLLAAPAAQASVVLPQTVEGLARRADAVVRGRAEGSVARVSRDGKLIHTVTTVRVHSALKGQVPASIEVRTPGGTVGDITQVVHGSASFTPGEEVVLFLHRERGEGRYSVEALALGKFEVVKAADGSALVSQKAPGLSVLHSDGVVRPARAVEPVPERDFLARVKRALAGGEER